MSVQASFSRFMTLATREAVNRGPSQVALSTSQIPHTQNATVNDQENLMSDDHGSVIHYEAAGLGFLGYRWLSRGERIDRQAALTTIAGA